MFVMALQAIVLHLADVQPCSGAMFGGSQEPGGSGNRSIRQALSFSSVCLAYAIL